MFEEMIAKSAIVRFIIECMRNVLASIQSQTDFNRLILAAVADQQKKIDELETLIKRDPKLASALEQQRRLVTDSKKATN